MIVLFLHHNQYLISKTQDWYFLSVLIYLVFHSLWSNDLKIVKNGPTKNEQLLKTILKIYFNVDCVRDIMQVEEFI